MNIVITKSQKRILSYAAIGIAVIIIFIFIIYLPVNIRMKKLRANVEAANQELNEIKKIKEVKEAIAKGYFYATSIESLKTDLDAIRQKIPSEKEGPLQYISTCARKFNLELISIKPSQEEIAIDDNKIQIKIKNASCLKLDVALRIKGAYKSIGAYLESLERDSPYLIVVDNISISKVSDKDILNADINLGIYLKEK